MTQWKNCSNILVLYQKIILNRLYPAICLYFFARERSAHVPVHSGSKDFFVSFDNVVAKVNFGQIQQTFISARQKKPGQALLNESQWTPTWLKWESALRW